MQAQGRPSMSFLKLQFFIKSVITLYFVCIVSHGQYVSNSPADLPMPSVKEHTLMWQGVGQPGYVGDSGIQSGATTQVNIE